MYGLNDDELRVYRGDVQAKRFGRDEEFISDDNSTYGNLFIIGFELFFIGCKDCNGFSLVCSICVKYQFEKSLVTGFSQFVDDLLFVVDDCSRKYSSQKFHQGFAVKP